MRIAVLAVAVAIAALMSVTARSAPSAPGRTVPCDEVIDLTRFPYVGSRDPKLGYRQVLGVVSVPPAYLEHVAPTRRRPWAYFSKKGLVVRASREAVTITVPRRWRKRVAIVWRNHGHGVFSSLRIAGCGADPKVGNAYAGGFYLRARSACVPLIFRVGTRRQAVSFGIGRVCGSN